MADLVSVRIHPNRFPAAVSERLRESLRVRAMDHQFHYDAPRQASAWLRVHEAYSPACRNAACEKIYDSAFSEAARRLPDAREIELVSLGSGGGRKDARLAAAIRSGNSNVRLRYIPVDVSPGLSLVSRASVVEAGVSPADCDPVVMDLEAAPDWLTALQGVLGKGAHRLICFFGMLPNCEGDEVFPKLAGLSRPGDLILMSANLSPGPDYPSGVGKVMPQYDNALTREWLMASLINLGFDEGDGLLCFSVRQGATGTGLLRIEGEFVFGKNRSISCEGERFDFAAGERFRLFFSYRHTPELIGALARRHGLTVLDSWVDAAGEEGLFLALRALDGRVASPD